MMARPTIKIFIFLLLCHIIHLNYVFNVMYGNTYSFIAHSDNEQLVKKVDFWF
jgi:hypothetical protein